MKERFTGCRRWLILLGITGLFSCQGRHVRTDLDTPVSGKIHISVDESFKPVMDEEIKVFEASYPKAIIEVHYKPEADCLRDLFKDSATRLVIVTRGLTAVEEQFFKDSLGYVPAYDKVANDAVAVIVNRQSPDSLLTLDEIKKVLLGKSREKAVFDGTSATSTVRYAIDSILQGQPLNLEQVMAVNGSRSVIDYIATHPDAIGFVGVSWVGNLDDTAQQALVKKVKMAAVECTACGSNIFARPDQRNIIYQRYPLVRGLYYILKENYIGLGAGFTGFLGLERGQLIFRRAYLGPAKNNFIMREASLR